MKHTGKWISCPCGWQGKGSQLVHGDFSEFNFIGDLECPQCFSLVAFWQAPLKGEEDKKEGPDKW